MIKILQFGEGNFLRAFAEHYIQTANENGIYDGKVAICQPRKNTKQDYKRTQRARLQDITQDLKLFVI